MHQNLHPVFFQAFTLLLHGTFLQIRKRHALWMDPAPTHVLSLCAGYNLLKRTSWSCNMLTPPAFVLLIFLELRGAFIYLPFTFYLVRFGPLFHPVKLFWVPTNLPSHPAAELLNLPAPWPYQKEVRSVRRALIHLTVTQMITSSPSMGL